MRSATLARTVTPLALAMALAVAGTTSLVTAAPAGGSRPPDAADSARKPLSHDQAAGRAPRYPPLTSGGGSTQGTDVEGSTTSSPQLEADPLVSNGLGSPFCRGAAGEGVLSPARERDCETSGFSAAGAPTENYGIDVHIDTGLFGVSSGTLLSVVQNVVVAPVWMALVWSVHALVVMLEWCFAIDLLDSPASGGIGRGLREMQASFTYPWLAAVLAVAAVLALYNGLIRRRVADTVGQAVVMGAMMAGGLWLIADPTGTVGALGGWANQASLGTLAVSARGTPSSPGRALTESMAALFASAIEAPWCYLEFGDVGWCRDPAHLDPRLRQTAMKIATAELAVVGCRYSAGPLQLCVPRRSPQAGALERSAELLREANSNGAIFLALPANGPARNSINEPGSLLRAICESSEATRCRGPTAAQAQFRTNGGTWSRVGGLLLILAGVLGMLLLFGFIALRLLGAAIFSLLYLLLAPAVILAPALGEPGRALFRRWAAQLLAAVVSKLLFSFLLGVVLAVLSILASLEALGWWTQWLLMSAFWWGAYARRHQALAFTEGAVGREHRVSRGRAIGRLEAPYVVRRAAGHARERVVGAREELRRREKREPAVGAALSVAPDEQARRMLEGERRDAGRRDPVAGEAQVRLSAMRARLGRLRDERERALAVGDTRRAAELACRSRRVETEVSREQRELDASRRVLDAGAGSSGQDSTVAREQERERGTFLDDQARLPGSLSRSGPRRDYPELAYLVGLGREPYRRLGTSEQRKARLEIDRELARRRQTMQTVAEPSDGRPAPLRVRPTDQVGGERAGRSQPSGPDRSGGAGVGREAGAVESSVMRDAREVAARRKRQLGLNRP